METYKVALIDDELIIIQGLQIIIDWEEFGFEICGTATNGDEGLELIRREKPDIVISDICMPNRSGLDMISQALSICQCKFIILTGYPDFSYAKQSMSLGVHNYLLKPVDEQELISTLKKLREQLDYEKQSQSKISEYRDISQKLHMLTRDDSLRDIMDSYFESDEDFLQALSNYDICVTPGKEYFCVAFQYLDTTSFADIRANIEQLLNHLDGSYLTFYYGNNTMIGIFSLSANADTDSVTKTFSHLHTDFNEKFQTELCIGIGNLYCHIHQLPFSCKQSIYALSYKIIRGHNSVNPYSGNLKKAHFIQNVPEELWQNYQNTLHQPNFSSISNAIRKIFYYMEVTSDMPLLGIQINTLNLIIICMDSCSQMSGLSDKTDYDHVDFLQQISALHSPAELAKYAENVVYNIMNQSREKELTKPSELILQVENYINSHYLENLSLIAVAQIFYITPIYLSQTFKKQTGQLYLDYVTDIKINAAKKMLLSSDMMVYEIAEKLHYKDAKYFSKLFEKRTGQKPSDFRKNSHSLLFVNNTETK